MGTSQPHDQNIYTIGFGTHFSDVARTTIKVMIFTKELPRSFRCGQLVVVQRSILHDKLKVYDTSHGVISSLRRFLLARMVPNIFTYNLHNNLISDMNPCSRTKTMYHNHILGCFKYLRLAQNVVKGLVLVFMVVMLFWHCS